jgi:hypothetical protein
MSDFFGVLLVVEGRDEPGPCSFWFSTRSKMDKF